MTVGVVCVFHGNAGSRRFDHVQRRAVAPEHFHRRPLGQHGNRRRRMRAEFLGRMNNFSAHDGENRFDGFDIFLRRGEKVVAESNEIRQLSDCNRPLLSALARKPTAALGVESERFLPAESVFVGIHRNAADAFARYQPIERNPRIIARHARCICARADGDAELQHLPHRRGSLRGLLAVAIHEVFALVGHAMLDRDAAAERLHAFQVAVGDRLAVIEEPVQSPERHVAVDFLEHIQEARDALIVSGVQTERPFVGGQKRDDILEFAFQ